MAIEVWTALANPTSDRPYPARLGPSIFQATLTIPKVSSITVKVEELDWWQVDWVEYHREDEDDAVFGERRGR